ncbi:hypothetical protein ABK040_002104 [Willaertia magna]
MGSKKKDSQIEQSSEPTPSKSGKSKSKDKESSSKDSTKRKTSTKKSASKSSSSASNDKSSSSSSSKQKKPSKRTTKSSSTSIASPSTSTPPPTILSPSTTQPSNSSQSSSLQSPVSGPAIQFPIQLSNKKNLQTIETPYYDEISNMMFVFGDARKTNSQSVKIIEMYTKSHLLDLIVKACKLSNDKESATLTLGADDFLFIFRNDNFKLSRFESILKLKEMRKKDEDISLQTSDIGSTETLKTKKRKLIHDKSAKKVKRNFDPIWDIGQFSDDDLMNEETMPTVKKNIPPKNVNNIQKKNNETNNNSTQTNVNFEKIKTDEDILIEKYLDSKLKAADDLTKYMSVDEYMDYTKSRESNFISKGIKKFRHWLDITTDSIKLQDNAIEILAIEAYETVGLLTQLSLITIIDKEQKPITKQEDNVFRAAGLLTENQRRIYSQFPHLQIYNPFHASNTDSILWNRIQILPNHVLDAIRLLHPPSPFYSTLPFFP